jgi:hypothetical protein
VALSSISGNAAAFDRLGTSGNCGSGRFEYFASARNWRLSIIGRLEPTLSSANSTLPDSTPCTISALPL